MNTKYQLSNYRIADFLHITIWRVWKIIICFNNGGIYLCIHYWCQSDRGSATKQ